MSHAHRIKEILDRPAPPLSTPLAAIPIPAPKP